VTPLISLPHMTIAKTELRPDFSESASCCVLSASPFLSFFFFELFPLSKDSVCTGVSQLSRRKSTGTIAHHDFGGVSSGPCHTAYPFIKAFLDVLRCCMNPWVPLEAWKNFCIKDPSYPRFSPFVPLFASWENLSLGPLPFRHLLLCHAPCFAQASQVKDEGFPPQWTQQ